MGAWKWTGLALVFLGCTELGDAEPWSSVAGAEAPLKFALTWHQDGQSQLVQCHHFKTTNDVPIDVDRVTVDFPGGSHHVHIYRSTLDVADGVSDCSGGIDWRTWSLLMGVQTEPLDWQLPDGVTIPLAAHQQLMVQVHWLNLEDPPVDPVIHVALRPAAPGMHLGTAFGIARDVRALPGERKQVAGWVGLPEGAQLVAMMGHFHARGRAFHADLRSFGAAEPGRELYRAAGEATLEFQQYLADPVIAGAGDGVAYECDFENDTNGVLTWGPDTATQEHCNAAIYYYPAVGSGTVALTGDVTALRRERETWSVQLEGLAGPLGVDVALLVDADQLTCPMTVHVPAWTRSATFDVELSPQVDSASLAATSGATIVRSVVQ